MEKQKKIKRKIMTACMFLLMLISLTACSYGITVVLTDGHATDVVDETSDNSANASIAGV